MIETFVFFDLETTGLITKSVMPKITEIAMIAVSRSNMCNTKDGLPRVLHKMTLPINPDNYINKMVTNITGLSNENLTGIKSFDNETYILIMNFIEQLTAPICFVAYNGNKFDYPIFLSELSNINEAFSEHILCIDMLDLVKNFFATKKDIEKPDNSKVVSSTSNSSENFKILLNDGHDDLLSEALDKFIIDSNLDDSSNGNVFKCKDSVNPSDCSTDVLNAQEINYYKKLQERNEKTPESQIIKLKKTEKLQDKKGSYTRRRLTFTESQPPNYKLLTIYKVICGSDYENAHNAEADCLAMLHCSMQLRSFFFEWADKYAVPLVNYSLEQK